jgi:hypothetical protein
VIVLSRSTRTIGAATTGCVAAIAIVACGDGSKLVLNQQAEAHRVSSDLRVQFTRAADASNRAVMADTDEASSGAAHEAEQATLAVQRDVDTLHQILQNLGDRDELAQLDRFTARFDEYRRLDAAVLPLAVENTNIKAQRLAFGPAQNAVIAFRQALETAAKSAAAKNAAAIDALAARAIAAALEIQVIEARHIAESDETAMSRMESSMAASGTAARKAIDSLRVLLPPASQASLAAAAAALDRLTAANAEIVALSRRNSNVRSLALSLGRKRTVTAECSDLLQQLQETLASHHFAATR